MATLGHDPDFSTFLSELDLDLASFPDGLNVDGQQQHPGQQAMAQAQLHQNLGANMIETSNGLAQNSSIFEFSMPMDVQFPLSQNGHHQMPGQGPIPPTPNSVEMHGENQRFLQQQYEAHRMMMEHYQMKKNEAAGFTPYLSPVIPEHDSGYDMHAGYIAPGAYSFSPLTSPALEGQNAYHTNNSDTSIATSSPKELDVDMQESPHLQPVPVTRSRKRAAAPRSTKTRSPITKPQTKRKSGLNVSMSQTEIASQQVWAPSPNFPLAQQIPNDSVSPEPLSEPSMGPPLKPASATQSPAIVANGPRGSGQSPIPATPASYLQIQRSLSSPRSDPQQARGTSAEGRQPVLTPLSLPEAAATPLRLDMDSPDIGSRKTPKLGPMSTPSGPVTPGANGPLTASNSALNSPISSGFSKKADGKGRAPKKARGSISSGPQASPAIRPKISPSIKPLLPEGAPHGDEAHTIFLASRSNYQNLIEGTHVPGVSYPTELSTNLTSKRTSHKIAEQGRRNRINLALQEMQTLLPKGTGAAAESMSPGPEEDIAASSSGKKGGSGGESSKANGNSKAATVESAIDYIRTLKEEQEQMRTAAAQKEKEVDTLRLKLLEMERLCREKGVTLAKVPEEEEPSIPASKAHK
ncbi:hypothetical protein BT63DRAFT_215592 [Microthyrium microscopicum]|uniref:BHLH domain-containing protein n=1 Tax=Microthyrium microscopicum TaxID=703497 RepID=A0A6A6UGH7_9PEZI|nr:hypothetical protein BT63DRAFT_215592 [Microthyrium microscopicum]